MTVVLTESPVNLPAAGAYTTSAQRPSGEREPQREDDQALCPGQWRRRLVSALSLARWPPLVSPTVAQGHDPYSGLRAGVQAL